MVVEETYFLKLALPHRGGSGGLCIVDLFLILDIPTLAPVVHLVCGNGIGFFKDDQCHCGTQKDRMIQHLHRSILVALLW